MNIGKSFLPSLAALSGQKRTKGVNEIVEVEGTNEVKYLTGFCVLDGRATAFLSDGLIVRAGNGLNAVNEDYAVIGTNRVKWNPPQKGEARETPVNMTPTLQKVQTEDIQFTPRRTIIVRMGTNVYYPTGVN